MLLCRRTLWRGIQRLNFSSNAPEGSLPDFGPVAEATGKKQKLPDGRTGWQFAFKNEFSLFKLPPDFLPPETLASKEDLLQWYRQVCEIRRMEMAADAMYKAKLIRGFCHLSIGQVFYYLLNVHILLKGSHSSWNTGCPRSQRCHYYGLSMSRIRLDAWCFCSGHPC